MTNVRQLGVRKVLGASRRELITQCVIESGIATVIALTVAAAIMLPVSTVISEYVRFDVRSILSDGFFWGVVLLAALGVIILSAIYPIAIALNVRATTALRPTHGRARNTFKAKLLIGTQFVVTSILLVIVLVIHQQRDELKRITEGDSTDQVLVVTNNIVNARIDINVFRSELIRHPSIVSVSSTDLIPWEPRSFRDVVSRATDASADKVTSAGDMVSYGFFKTMGFKLLAGRVFNTAYDDVALSMRDSDPTKPISMVVDRALSEELGFATPQETVNKLVYRPNPFGDKPPQSMRIIGVVENNASHFIANGGHGNSYQLNPSATFPVLRIRGDAIPSALSAIDTTWKNLAPTTPMQRRFVDDLFYANYRTFEHIGLTLTLFTGFASVIAVLGLLGAVLHLITQRIHEIGVRKILGADSNSILIMLMRDVSAPIVIANLVAWPIAYVVAQIYLGMFVQRIFLTPVPFAMSLVLTLVIAWLAVGGQALHAARLNPAKVLRHE